MKCKLKLFLIVMLTSCCGIYSQNISDALNYSSNSYQGTARFNSMGGAFGALGGDLSAIAVNPASSAVLNDGHFSLSFGSDSKSGNASLLNSSNNFEKNNKLLLSFSFIELGPKNGIKFLLEFHIIKQKITLMSFQF